MAFTSLLRQSVTREAWQSADGYNEPTFATGVAVIARVQSSHTVTRVDGEEKVVKATIFVDGDAGWDQRDRITLPDGSKPQILAIEKRIGGDGLVHHTTVTLG